MRIIKLAVACGFIAFIAVALSGSAFGYPPFLVKAKKFGAKDCTFCHIEPEGGPPFNDRGQWLLAEKERRSAEVVDPAWLVSYKPGAGKAAKPAESPTKNDAAPAITEKPANQGSKIDPKVFDAYVGEYELPMFVLIVTKEGDKLFGQPQDNNKEELVPDSETEFTVTNVKAKVKFVKDDKGTVTHMVVTLNGQDFQGKKIK